MSNEIQMYDKTTALVDWTIASTKPMVVHCGGTSSSKTYSLMQVCFMRAIQNPGCVITVVGQDVPNLKKGAVRDAHNIVAATPKLADELLDGMWCKALTFSAFGPLPGRTSSAKYSPAISLSVMSASMNSCAPCIPFGCSGTISAKSPASASDVSTASSPTAVLRYTLRGICAAVRAMRDTQA